MKTNFIDSRGIKYDFEFADSDVTIFVTSSDEDRGMAIPVEQVVNNSGTWQFVKNDYLKMAPDAIVFIEKYCKNKAFW